MPALQLGTIGTSMITGLFVQAALQTEKMELHAVYSRKIKKADDFGEPFQSNKSYDKLEDFFADPELDVVYVASPNSLHYEQTIAALKAGKHVIVEKPAFFKPEHWDHVEEVAKEHNRVVIEAIRHMHEPNFEILKQEIRQIGEIKGATLPYMSYSSRYDLVREGEEPNIFSLRFAGGALMDLGVYPLYSAVALFGEPETVHCFVQKVETGVDGKGTAILRYPTFDVTLLFGKIVTSMIPAEIYGLDATLQVQSITLIDSIQKINAKTKESQSIPTKENADNMLFDEAKVYADVLQNPENPENKEKIAKWFSLSRTVGRTMYALRQSADIEFADD